MSRVTPIAVFVLLTAVSSLAQGASFTVDPAADAFVTTGPTGNLSGNNYGGAGSIGVSAPGLPKGEFQSALRFDLAAAASSFDATFGAGQWAIQSITLHLTATGAGNAIFNTPAAGSFSLSWMQNDAWTEGTGSPASPGASGITYTSLQSAFVGAGDESVGTFAWNGASSGAFDYALLLTPGLTADVLAGSAVSLRLLGADSSVSALFNSRSFVTPASRPSLTIQAVPEPASLGLCAIGLALLGARRRTASTRAP